MAEQAQNIKNTYNGLVKSVEYAVKRYGWSTSIQLSHYEEIRGQFARGSEEWLAADEKVFETRQTLLKEQAAAWQTFYSGVKSVNDGIAKLEEDYQKTLADRADAIAGSYKLFDEVKDPEQTSASQLTKNLRQQVESIRDFYGNLDTLSAKLADQDWGSALVEEIRAMGVSAASELKALLSMSDDQLSEYADLYGKKQTLANEIALKELRGLREQTDAQIRENLDSIKGLYEEDAPTIGKALPAGLVKGIREGLPAALDAAIEMARAIEDAVREKTETHSPSRLFARIAKGWMDGAILGVENGAERLRHSVTDAVDFSDLEMMEIPSVQFSRIDAPDIAFPEVPDLTVTASVDDSAVKKLLDTLDGIPDTVTLKTALSDIPSLKEIFPQETLEASVKAAVDDSQIINLLHTLEDLPDTLRINAAIGDDWKREYASIQREIEGGTNYNPTVPATIRQFAAGYPPGGVNPSGMNGNPADFHPTFNFAWYNEVGGRTVARRQQRFTEKEAIRQGENYIRVR